MIRFAVAMLVLLAGFGLGFAFAKGRRRVAAYGLLVLLGVVTVSLIPTVREIVQCRLRGGFFSRDAHPPELVGAWVGWDTSYPTPYCRLELEADGTGRYVFWYEQKQTGLWRVARWSVSGRRIEVSVESGERREQMRGEVTAGALSLQYFGEDGPDVTKNWFGPLRLVSERTDEEAKQAVQRALEQR